MPPGKAPERTVAPATAPSGSAFVPDRDLQWLVDPYPVKSGPAWLGADVATSIPLSEQRFVWLFGDTLLGTVSDQCSDGRVYCDRSVEPGGEEAMIRNSVGISERMPDGSFSRIVKYWRTENGVPAGIFAAASDQEFLWPLAGVRVGPYLLVTANRNTPQSGLAPVGNVLLRIENPDVAPNDWQYTRYEVASFVPPGPNGGGLSWTTALAPLGDHIYVVGQQGIGIEAVSVLARFASADLYQRDWTPRLEYLQRGAKRGALEWSTAPAPDRLHPVRGLPGTSESSMDQNAELGWFTYRLAPFASEIHLYTAPDLEGPWRDEGAVYALPPPWSTERRNCEGTQPTCEPVYVAYAVKAHPELAASGAQVLSYNVNLASGDLESAEQAAARVHGFYVPQLLVGPAGDPTP